MDWLDRKMEQYQLLADQAETLRQEMLAKAGSLDVARRLYWDHQDVFAVKEIGASLGVSTAKVRSVVGPKQERGVCAVCGADFWSAIESRMQTVGSQLCDACQEARAQEIRAERRAEIEANHARWQAEKQAESNWSYELANMPYHEYLATDEWAQRRKGALQRSGFRCQLCNGKGQLNVHHRTYERRGNERRSDLIVLCADCHKTFHFAEREK